MNLNFHIESLTSNILFDQPEYLASNKIPQSIEFNWKSVIYSTKILFSIQGDTAYSMPNAPYAGFSNMNDFNTGEARRLVSELKIFLEDYAVKKINIKQRPSFNMDIILSEIHSALIQGGFSTSTEINHHVVLKAKLPKLHSMELRKIKKCQNEQLIFIKEDSSKGHEIYHFLKKCRIQQNLIINITEDRFIHLLRLSNKYELYSIRNSERKLIAATVLVILNENIVYNYLPAFDRSFSRLSPLAYLQKCLYQILTERNFLIFDLGTSSVEGRPQNGLISFKERMGAIRTKRYTYDYLYR